MDKNGTQAAAGISDEQISKGNERNIAHNSPRLYSPLTLAFLGDGVFELLVREKVVQNGSMSPAKLHTAAVRYVCADAQARLYDVIEPLLSEEERDLLRRGRNASGITPPKNADPAHYRKATAVETLFGYLHLCGRYERERELFALAEPLLTSGK